MAFRVISRVFLGVINRVCNGICSNYPLIMHGLFAKMDTFLFDLGTVFPAPVAGLCAKFT